MYLAHQWNRCLPKYDMLLGAYETFSNKIPADACHLYNDLPKCHPHTKTSIIHRCIRSGIINYNNSPGSCLARIVIKREQFVAGFLHNISQFYTYTLWFVYAIHFGEVTNGFILNWHADTWVRKNLNKYEIIVHLLAKNPQFDTMWTTFGLDGLAKNYHRPFTQRSCISKLLGARIKVRRIK